MPDLVVTVPRNRWAEWVAEGALPGDPGTATALFAFGVGKGPKPPIQAGERVYVVAWDRLRGYAPLVRVANGAEGWSLVRGGAAVATTITGSIRGFPGFKERWWKREDERRFDDWMTEGVDAASAPRRPTPTASRSAPPVEMVEGEDDPDPELDEPLDDAPAAPATPGKRTLTAKERKLLAEGIVLCGGGKVYKINGAPWHGFAPDRCPVCAEAQRANTTPRAHPHRLAIACRYCKRHRVFPRGPRGSRAPEVFCLACGRWWDPADPRDIDIAGALAATGAA